MLPMNDHNRKIRCKWAGNDTNLPYHDTEWGVPVHDDLVLFEFLILEGAQAGLSWDTILKKRDSYRRAFDGFDPNLIAAYDDEKCRELMADAGIIRNRLKIASAVRNAQAFIKVQQEFGSFDNYIWGFVDGKPILNAYHDHADVPVSTDVSDRISKDLKKRGFNFVGTTIIYSFMQAVGMVNDHLTSCFRYAETAGERLNRR